MAALINRKTSLSVLILLLLGTSLPFTTVSVFESHASSSTNASIEVEGFRWSKYPIKILVDMNQWSTPNYASAVHEAVDIWLMSIRTYCSTYNDTTLTIMSFTFYVSNVNATTNYDIFITFTADEISPNIVGLTSYQWNPISHEPRLPVTINLTTYSRTASYLFVRNVVMHEFGHALGLGHASSRNTQNGPELMYFATPTEHAVYPSTLDIYGQIMIYKGYFKQSVQLPANIPYEIVQPATDVLNNPPSSTETVSDDLFKAILKELFETTRQVWQTEQPYLIVLIICVFVLIIVKAMDKK